MLATREKRSRMVLCKTFQKVNWWFSVLFWFLLVAKQNGVVEDILGGELIVKHFVLAYTSCCKSN